MIIHQVQKRHGFPLTLFLFSLWLIIIKCLGANSKYTCSVALKLVIVILTGYGSSRFLGLSVDQISVQTFKGASSPQCAHQQ